jgi:hypothetical protein
MNMRLIFKLLDICFILFGLPFLYFGAANFLRQGSGTLLHEGFFILAYLLIAITNYRDKWNEKEKKGFLTYPLLVGLALSHFFQIKVALIGLFLTLLLTFFKRVSTIFVSGALLTLWAISYIEAGSIRSLWGTSILQDFLLNWKIIFPLLGGWIYLLVIGRLYPKTVKDVRKKKSSKGVRLKWFRWKMPTRLLPRIRFRFPGKPKTTVEDSVPVQQVVSLIKDMTKEKGLQWTSAATETLSSELQHKNWKKDRFSLWAQKFVESLNLHQGTFIVDTQAVNRTLEKMHEG